MPTTVEAVEGYLKTDLALSEALSRGFLNVRKTARWLIQNQEWDATEEAVVSALRRYEPDPGIDLEAVFHLLQSSHVTVDGTFSLLSLPKAREYAQAVGKIFQTVGPEGTFAVLPERKRINVLVDESAVDDILCGVEGAKPKFVSRRLAELQIRFPEEGRVASSALGILVNVLGYRNVEVKSVFGHLPTCSLLVPERDAPRAFRLVKAPLDR